MSGPNFRQLVPRPERSSLGPPPPWCAPSPERQKGSLFSLRVPTLSEVASVLDTPSASFVDARSAVLVLLFEADDILKVLLIRRAAALQRDPGHVAFPGGRIEEGERPFETALRETEEELGVAKSLVRVIGSLERVARSSDGEVVAPLVGALNVRPALSPNPAEVDVVLEVPLEALLRDGVAWEERWASANGVERPMMFFAAPDVLGEDLIWGMTARILWDLCRRFVPSA